MAKYNISGIGSSLFEAYGSSGALKDNLVYVQPAEFGFRNADGTFTYVYGEGFAFDSVKGEFTGGTVSNIRHFDANGRYIDDITGLNLSIAAFEKALVGSDLASFLLRGDDILQAVYLRGTDTGVSLNGYAGDDAVFGSTKGDGLSGGGGDDMVSGRRGDDTLYGNDGNDKLIGNKGNDIIYGDDDRPFGAAGIDLLNGGDGNDRLDGGRGNDVLIGGKGRDWLAGGNDGDDLLAGGNGKDTFFFSFSADDIRPVGAEWGNDIIRDFEVGVDQLILSDMLGRPMSYGNDETGNAVIRIDADNSVTLIGIDATKVSLDDLLA